MPHDDVREVNGCLEFFKDGRQTSVGGDLIPQTVEEMSALRDALYNETTFGERYVFDARNFEILGKVSAKLNRHAALPTAITRSRLFEAYTVADAAGGLTEFGNLERVPEEIVVTTPRAADGRFADAHQLLREEVRRLLSDPTVSAQSIRQRADRDRAFGDAFRAELAPAAPAQRNDLQEGQHALDVAHYGAFARAFRLQANPKYMYGRITVGGVEYTKEEFEKHMAEAARLGLL